MDRVSSRRTIVAFMDVDRNEDEMTIGEVCAKNCHQINARDAHEVEPMTRGRDTTLPCDDDDDADTTAGVGPCTSHEGRQRNRYCPYRCAVDTLSTTREDEPDKEVLEAEEEGRAMERDAGEGSGAGNTARHAALNGSHSVLSKDAMADTREG